MRPPQTAAVRPGVRRPAGPADAPAPPRDDDPVRDAEAAAKAGGFHESSYELRTGMDMMETEWPEDTTLPGQLDPLP